MTWWQLPTKDTIFERMASFRTTLTTDQIQIGFIREETVPTEHVLHNYLSLLVVIIIFFFLSVSHYFGWAWYESPALLSIPCPISSMRLNFLMSSSIALLLTRSSLACLLVFYLPPPACTKTWKNPDQNINSELFWR